MQVRYIPTQKDAQAVTRLLTRGVYRLAQVTMILSLAAFIVFVIIRANQTNSRLGLEVLTAFYAFFLVNFGVRLFISKRYNVREPDSFDVETTATIDPVGLTIATARKRLVYRWDCFTAVELTKSYLLIFTSPIRAHYIPLRAFYDERQAREFAAQAESYHQAALSNPLPLDMPAPGVIPMPTPTLETETAVWPPRPRVG